LPKDVVVAYGLRLFARKNMASNRFEMGLTAPIPIDLEWSDVDDALQLSRNLIAEADPWRTIEDFRKWIAERGPPIISAVYAKGWGKQRSENTSPAPVALPRGRWSACRRSISPRLLSARWFC
jgi:hypothetical protein